MPYSPRRPYTRRPTRKQKKRKSIGVLLCALIILAIFAGIAVWLTQPRDGISQIEGPPFVIALDAGHGGKDVGADGIIQEVTLTEQTTAYLYELLKNDPDFEPILCREEGEGASPNERARFARQNGASLLFSIHGNSSEDPAAYGFESYPVPPGRNWHEESRLLASYVAEEMQAAGNTLRGEGGIRYLYYQGEEKVFTEASDTTPTDWPSFAVLDNSKCVAVLVEQCFVTNPSDVAAFGSNEGTQRAAQCYYQAIRRFFNAYISQNL